MCPGNTAHQICGISLDYYKKRRRYRPRVRWCFETKVIVLSRLFALGVVPTTIDDFIANDGHMMLLASHCNLEAALRTSTFVTLAFKDLVKWSCKKHALQTGSIILAPTSGDWMWNKQVASTDPRVYGKRLQSSRDTTGLDLLISTLDNMNLGSRTSSGDNIAAKDERPKRVSANGSTGRARHAGSLASSKPRVHRGEEPRDRTKTVVQGNVKNKKHGRRARKLAGSK